MADEKYIMGIFRDETAAAGAVADLKQSDFRIERVDSPIPSNKISEALGVRKSPVGWFTLAGGIIGFFTGFALAAFTSFRWGLVVGGKPVAAWIPFFIVGFECTILFAVLGNVVGFLALMRLPAWKELEHYDPRCSGEHYGILATCSDTAEKNLIGFFKGRGADITVFDERGIAGESEQRSNRQSRRK
jgi:hypothetical protein